MSEGDGTISMTEAKRLRALAGTATGDGGKDQLLRSENGAAKPLLFNAAMFIRHDPNWKDALGYDVFRHKITLRRPPPWRPDVASDADVATDADWTDLEDLLLATYLQEHGIAVGPQVAGEAATLVAREAQFHPVQEYLESNRWDGRRRIDTWLTYYLGVEDTDYARAVGACWLIAGVARVYRPGCKVDTALVLEGDQGRRKSTAINVLGAPWVTDELADFGSKDAAMQLAGRWIIEIAELEGMRGANIAKIKAFMSRAIDRYRPPYGRHVIDVARQCIFAGSVNENEYLRDATGGRRFWPVECKSIDIDALARDRDQLWAEARARFEAGESWWLRDRALELSAMREQRTRYREDPWSPSILDYLEARQKEHAARQGEDKEPPHVTIEEVLRRAVKLGADQWGNIDESRWQQKDSNRVAACLKSLGWKRCQIRIEKTRRRRWVYVPHHDDEHGGEPPSPVSPDDGADR
jgi:predicted P-loop ATPase